MQGLGPDIGIHAFQPRWFPGMYYENVGLMLWKRAGLRPADIDVLQLYENFTGPVLMALCEMGFCKPEDVEAFVAGGALEGPDARLPFNTSGGNIAEAYIHGLEMVVEAVRQVRGDSTCQQWQCRGAARERAPRDQLGRRRRRRRHHGAGDTDVDLPTGSGPSRNRKPSTLIEYFGAADDHGGDDDDEDDDEEKLLFTSVVPASAGDASLSFFGVVFEQARIARVRIQSGSVAPGPDDGRRRDVVMMDDFIYGEPQPAD